jgi:hypothetical protein
MSVLIEVSKIFESTTSDGQHQSLVAEAVTMLTARGGGLNALKQNFEQNGLGHINFILDRKRRECSDLAGPAQVGAGQRLRRDAGHKGRDLTRDRD